MEVAFPVFMAVESLSVVDMKVDRNLCYKKNTSL